MVFGALTSLQCPVLATRPAIDCQSRVQRQVMQRVKVCMLNDFHSSKLNLKEKCLILQILPDLLDLIR